MAEFWHVTWVTHNSRISRRMVDYKIKKSSGFCFNEVPENTITEIIADIVIKYNYKLYAYNICKDHVHIIVECDPDKLSDIVKTLKGLSSLFYKEKIGIARKAAYSLWAQKYNKLLIKTDKQFRNTVLYIIHNRSKHELPENKGLQSLAIEMIRGCGNTSHVNEYRAEVDRICID